MKSPTNMEPEARVIHGANSADIEQGRAAALDELRKCDAWILITVAKTGKPSYSNRNGEHCRHGFVGECPLTDACNEVNEDAEAVEVFQQVSGDGHLMPHLFDYIATMTLRILGLMQHG